MSHTCLMQCDSARVANVLNVLPAHVHPIGQPFKVTCKPQMPLQNAEGAEFAELFVRNGS